MTQLEEDIQHIAWGYAINRVSNGYTETDDEEMEIATWTDWALERIEEYKKVED